MNILLKKVLRKIGVNPLVLYPLIYHKRYTNGGGKDLKDTDLATAIDMLNDIQSFKGYGNCYCKNEIHEEYDLQIIVPVYNAEKYIRRCLDSLIDQQTEYSYIITVVNDGSTDGTANILKQYVDKPEVQVISQRNQGLSGARNRGLECVRGRYVAFVDSDDYLADGAIQTLMKKAIESGSDLVEGGYSNFYDSGKSTRTFRHKNTDCGSNYSSLYGYPWGKVIKSSIFKNLHFPEKYWFEDTIMNFLVYPQCKRICTVHDIVYMYRVNFSGITQTSAGNPKMLDSLGITMLTLKESVRYNIMFDDIALEKFALQVIINAQRISSLKDKDVDRAVFDIHRYLYLQYYNGIDTKNKWAKYLLNNLRHNDFIGYRKYISLA